MFPSLLSCPSCKEPLIPSSDHMNEGTCHGCQLVISWKKLTSALEFDFLDSVEIVDSIELQYESEEPYPLNASPEEPPERRTKFSKLGKEDFQVKNSSEKSLSKYEDTVYAPNREASLNSREQALIKPEYMDLASFEDQFPEKNKSKLPLFFIIITPLLLCLASYFIYKERPEFINFPEKTTPPVVIKEAISHKKAEECLTRFFTAPSWQEALQFTLQDPNIKRSLEQYWTKNEIEAHHHLKSSFLSDQESISHFFGVLTKTGSQLFYSILEHPEIGTKVDWRSSHEIDEISLSDLLATSQKSPIQVRGKLKAILQKHPSYPADKFSSYKLSDPEDNTLTVFIPKSDPLYKPLQETFQENLPRGIKSISVILSVVNDSKKGDIARVRKIISTLPQEDHFFNVALPYTIDSQDD